MKRTGPTRPCIWFLLFALLLVGCGGDDGGSASTPFRPQPVCPDPDWEVEAPEEHGMDALLLEQAAAYAQEHDSNCLVVTRDGVIVGEWYWNGWDQETEQNLFSVTKSFTSALVGIAQEHGALDIHERASEYIDAWRGTASEEVTIRDLISNDSGRYWDFITDYVAMFLVAPDKTAFAIGLGQQHEPGTYWEYNNSAIQTLERVLKVATDTDVAEFARDFLFDPLGMASSYGRDPAGNPLTFSNATASCRDMARFGLLYLRHGRWVDDLEVIPEDWVQESTQPSTTLNAGYGYLWWLNREGHWVLPSAPLRQEGDGRILDGVPEELFRASGAFNQIIAVDPGTHIVFTRLGGITDPADVVAGNFVETLTRKILGAVIDTP